MSSLIDESLRQRLLASIAGDSLVLICGAGLSMADPSNVPSAWRVAQNCAAKYRQMTGCALPAGLEDNIELLAEHFFGRNELQNVLLKQLIDWSEFSKRPANKGHDAVADFLATRLLAVALSTNLDTLIEKAASQLGEPDFYPWVEAEDINRSQHPHSPLVKLHGCASRTRWETLWCKQQMEKQPLKNRIQQLASWVRGHFPNRDLLVVGFWTDWGYLNQILTKSIVSTEPRSVIVVDPSSDSALKNKSPELWEWATKKASFTHVNASGDAFLDELRHIVSSHFIRGVWDKGRSIYEGVMCNKAPSEADGALSSHSTESLYRIRRDLTGVPNTSVVREKTVADGHSMIGLLHIALLASGATMSSNAFKWNSESFRIVNTPNHPLSKVEELFSAEPPDPSPTSRNIAVGAFDDGGVPANIVRKGVPGGIIRHTPAVKWETHERILAELKRVVR